MIDNLTEGFLASLIPEEVLKTDTRGLMTAVLSGLQDRYGDLRSFARKINLLAQPDSLPDRGNNVVLVDLLSAQGKVYTRSLDILDSTPPDGTVELARWCGQQLNLQPEQMANIRYGLDPLCRVDADTRDLLAATCGAILYQSGAVQEAEVDGVKDQILQSYFARLKRKGTEESFEALGRILGFTDVRMTPCFGRLSPHLPNDAGAEIDAGDFLASPEYQPQQVLSPFYNPFKTNDGPFFEWSGTISLDRESSAFVTQAVNGFSPFVLASIINDSGEAVAPIEPGVYVLTGGGPQAKASVDAGDIRFTALADGEFFNGVKIHITAGAAANERVLFIVDRLSAVKYRSSYFDLGMAVDAEEVAGVSRATEIFGSSAARPNKDLKDNPALTAVVDGTAVTPYRAWAGGAATGLEMARDFLVTMNGSISGTGRVQVTSGTRQYNLEEMLAAGAQVAVALEEVRPATRLCLRAQTGLLGDDDVVYAKFVEQTPLGHPDMTLILEGDAAGNPLPPYRVDFTLEGETLGQEQIGEVLFIHGASPVVVNGTFDYTTEHYRFSFSANPAGSLVAHWTPTSTEVVRPEPV